MYFMVMPISPFDYLKLLQDLEGSDSDYQEDDDVSVPDESWIWGESPLKEKMLGPRNGAIDVTKYKKESIKEALYKSTNLQVGDFTLKIERYNGRPGRFESIKPIQIDLSMNIAIWERKYKTPTGNPCKMDYRLDLHKDNRFVNKPWLTFFANSGLGTGKAVDVPVDTVVDIIRWLQALKRLTAFL
jgi:hypothetical protein